MNPVIAPTDATLGAMVSSVRLAALDDATFATIEEAWHTHAVLIFPDQHLSEEEQVAFTERFGPLERSLTKTHTQGDPAIIHLSNVQEGRHALGGRQRHGEAIEGQQLLAHRQFLQADPGQGARRCLRSWYRRTAARQPSPTCVRPMTPSIPPCRSGSPTGSPCTATRTARARSAAWAGSPRTSGDSLPPVEQPVIRTHPATGRRNLYIGRHASHIVGEDRDESRRLLEELCADACRPPRIHIHKWQEGDLVLWGQPLRPASRPRPSPGPAAPHGPHHHRRRLRRGQRVGCLSLGAVSEFRLRFRRPPRRLR